MKMWRKIVSPLLHSDSFVPKATSNPLSCCYDSSRSTKALLWSIFENWYSDTENSFHVDCYNYCCYRHSCSRPHIQKDNIPAKKEKESTKPAAPLCPRAVPHLFAYGKLCSRRLKQAVGQKQHLGKVPRARAVLMLSSHTANVGLLHSAQHIAKVCARLLCRERNSAWGYPREKRGLQLPPGSEVRCVAWPSRKGDLLSCTVLSKT